MPMAMRPEKKKIEHEIKYDRTDASVLRNGHVGVTEKWPLNWRIVLVID